MRSASVPPRRSQPPAAAANDAIGDQLVDEIWFRSRSSLPISIIVLLAGWPIVRGPASASQAALVAYVTLLATNVVRFAAALWIVPHLARVPMVKRRLALAGSLASGLTFGALNVAMYLHTDALALGLWLAIVVGLTGGSAVSLGARPEAFVAYTLPTVAPIIVAAAIWFKPGMGSIIVCCTLWIVYCTAQVVQYRKSRVEYLGMNFALNHKNAQLAAKNVALEEMTQRADRIFSALAEALPGRTLAGRYKLVSRIGSGGFSVVFRATHTEIQRPVAVKIFRPQPGNDSAAALERFRYEGTASGRTRHPNVVEVLDAGISDDGIPFIAMELLDGHSLDAELSRGRLSLPRAASLLGQACRGLAAAHAAGVIHRDVKPENIFIHRTDGRTEGADGAAARREIVKVLDFGIAKVVGDAQAAMNNFTGTGALLGTPLYMAPERFLGQQSDESADAYSVGIILYQALSGELPYQGTMAEIMMQAVAQKPPHLRSRAPHVPEHLADLVMRALADEPAARPTVAELADALEVASLTPAAAPDLTAKTGA